MEQAQAIRDLWRVFRRRFAILAGVALLGAAISMFVAYLLPPVYESSAKILVESQQIPTELARSTVTASAAERLQLIEQRLMTRDNLFNMIEELGLFSARDDLTLSEKIGLVRDATKIKAIAVSGKRQRRNDTSISAFTISVSFNDPGDAARIANEFVTTVLDQNLRARTERASETLGFFEQEEDRLSGALATLESEITIYKRDNEAALPDSLEFRRSELSRLAQTDQELDRRILELEEERGTLEATLEMSGGTAAPDAALSAEEREIRRLEALLTQKRALFSENHREVRTLKAQIAALEATLPTTTNEDGTTTAQSIQEMGMRRQIDLLGTQITLLKDQKAAIDERRTALELSIQQTPNIEMTINGLYRRHAEIQEQLSTIVRKRVEAETGERLEMNQQAERFEVIENPVVAEKPVSPNRRKILMLGSGVSMALAVALAFLIEIMNPAIRSAAQMERMLDLRPVATIPYIQTAGERRRRRFWLTTVVLLLVAGLPALLFAIDQYYLPLELLGVRIVERTGLDEIIRIIEARL
ncbi:MAG: Wzz/FepE/Etk N-terminal domain-containing protein [Pseudomonadota bacterium]